MATAYERQLSRRLNQIGDRLNDGTDGALLSAADLLCRLTRDLLYGDLSTRSVHSILGGPTDSLKLAENSYREAWDPYALQIVHDEALFRDLMEVEHRLLIRSGLSLEHTNAVMHELRRIRSQIIHGEGDFRDQPTARDLFEKASIPVCEAKAELLEVQRALRLRKRLRSAFWASSGFLVVCVNTMTPGINLAIGAASNVIGGGLMWDSLKSCIEG